MTLQNLANLCKIMKTAPLQLLKLLRCWSNGYVEWDELLEVNWRTFASPSFLQRSFKKCKCISQNLKALYFEVFAVLHKKEPLPITMHCRHTIANNVWKFVFFQYQRVSLSSCHLEYYDRIFDSVGRFSWKPLSLALYILGEKQCFGVVILLQITTYDWKKIAEVC